MLDSATSTSDEENDTTLGEVFTTKIQDLEKIQKKSKHL